MRVSTSLLSRVHTKGLQVVNVILVMPPNVNNVNGTVR